MSPLTLFIIRHAEKPGEAWPGPGLTEGGKEDSESLVIRGWQRAGAWAALFGSGLVAGTGGGFYAEPDRIYAAAPGPHDRLNHGPSRRPAETVWPLAERLGLKTDLGFPRGQEGGLVKELLSLSGVVLVAWEHKAIVEDILPKIPIEGGAPPTRWPSERYDVVLRFDRAIGETNFLFRQMFPMLLPGDSDTPLT